jgi:CRISPR-associated protein Cas6
MGIVDLVFPVVGSALPTDHAYRLYAGLSRLLPCVHDRSLAFALAAVTGRYGGGGTIQLDPGVSRLRFRLAATDIPRLLPLAGRCVTVSGHPVRLGTPHVEALRPAERLIAHVVAIKKAIAPESFLSAVRQRLDALEIAGRATIPTIRSGPRTGEPRRRVVRIKGKAIVGYALLVSELTPEESVRLQERGLGGRTRIGCGFFLPVREGV